MIDKHLQAQYEALTTNLATVRSTIAEAALRSGRQPDAITLVAVSKTRPLEAIQVAAQAGVRDFGENRVQEALQKIAAFPTPRWHLIGHLQSNKANKVVGAFQFIHSVDSLHLALALQRQAEKLQIRQSILLQVNISGETSKEGMQPDEVPGLARQIVALPNLEVQGLMTIAPRVEEPETVRPIFRALRILRDQLQQEIPDSSWSQLSMGMTDDYCVAIEEGATIVRVGRAIFGERIDRGELQ
ncbi:YggS family pyridoxal phosphate-dependent enzyme [Tengunoibacter tsumagoiensis]|uniref:Pyridoxal phosphate homeostasis protein n=1 Tax=Tengunoibacter tsumagoiensis TaxID=2014871 RepID=A0A402A4P1_9CHLR|nr:YggS family pyridoxal phosphate-dependent enzyme [Tengunoibacter tsumagoiensis]GCE14118.1 YggS family pyridoxal phosphate enzyme [Tengunoibacter tsumagoiensis]